jgi:putative membrane protein
MLGLLAAVVYGHGRALSAPGWFSWLPGARHMLRAVLSSALFLVSYLVYHSIHGDSRFGGHGAVRAIYLFILITHIALSAIVLPFILSSLFFSLSGRFGPHKRVSRYTLPIWLYVSVSGVLVFVFLYVSHRAQ